MFTHREKALFWLAITLMGIVNLVGGENTGTAMVASILEVEPSTDLTGMINFSLLTSAAICLGIHAYCWYKTRNQS